MRLTWAWLGRRRFSEMALLQERLRDEILAGTRSDTLLLLEHEPVITLGRSARAEHVIAPVAELRRRGIEVVEASRGGDVTFHGPGQLVGYPVFRLRRGLLAHLETMAAALSAVLAEYGVEARWRRDSPGLWVGTDKICAFGVHVRHRVAIHGFALNVSTALNDFSLIVPCGLRDSGVTSLARLLGSAPGLVGFAQRVAVSFAHAFDLTMSAEPTDPREFVLPSSEIR